MRTVGLLLSQGGRLLLPPGLRAVALWVHPERRRRRARRRRWSPFQSCERRERYPGLFQVPGALPGEGGGAALVGDAHTCPPWQWAALAAAHRVCRARPLSLTAVWDLSSTGLFSGDEGERHGRSVFDILVELFDAGGCWGGKRWWDGWHAAGPAVAAELTCPPAPARPPSRSLPRQPLPHARVRAHGLAG